MNGHKFIHTHTNDAIHRQMLIFDCYAFVDSFGKRNFINIIHDLLSLSLFICHVADSPALSRFKHLSWRLTFGVARQKNNLGLFFIIFLCYNNKIIKMIYWFLFRTKV